MGNKKPENLSHRERQFLQTMRDSPRAEVLAAVKAGNISRLGELVHRWIANVYGPGVSNKLSGDSTSPVHKIAALIMGNTGLRTMASNVLPDERDLSLRITQDREYRSIFEKMRESHGATVAQHLQEAANSAFAVLNAEKDTHDRYRA